MNNLRNVQDSSKQIVQTEYLRTVLDPENFIRFDDGIIQASILRAATEEELNYRHEYETSGRMKDTIIKMIENSRDKISGEGLIEFLFALSTRKLRLYNSHLEAITKKIEKEIDNHVIKLFSKFISMKVIKK